MKLKILYALLLFIFLGACSTKKNTSLSRGYHNLTAHYNVYFNGSQSFKEGVKAVEEANEDDYTQVLSVFPESKPGSESLAASQMDRAIDKGAKLIKEHSIRKKPEKRRDDQSVKYKMFLSQNEYNKWVDNAYLLIGKSHFYKHDFYLAQQSFAYMFREFQTGPEWYEAEIWNARAAIELGDFAQAKVLLENYDLEGKAPSRLFGLHAATYADYYIRQGMYTDAIPFLKEAINGVESRYYFRRFNFILAQLYQKQKQYADASKAYLAVIKSNPPYQMAFNAKVNRAGVLFEEGGLEAVKKEIKRLLRDKRNSEYEDQIYYALAMAYKAEDEEDLAMENFLLSIEKSIDNSHQKGMSFYELSQIYFDKPAYKPAYYYLDTAVINLNENFVGLDVLKDRHKSLGSLVQNINMVEREDSLLKIMAMPQAQRLALIDGLIQKEKDRQEALRKAEQEGMDGNLFYDPLLSQSSNTQSQGGKWYFYNQTSVGMGKLEFEKRWGRRKLEDNWRRSNKKVVVEEPDFSSMEDVFAMDGQLPGDTTASNKIISDKVSVATSDPLSRDSYLKDLPSTPEMEQAAQKRIQEALLNQGLIYKDELHNIPYAAEAFNQLVTRFPEGVYLEDGLMNLYLCYQLQEDNAGMAQIKAKLMRLFPDGEFTAYLNDPEYFEKREARNKKMELLYEQTYSSYLFNNFDAPILSLVQAQQIDQESKLIAKFKFLAGLSQAKSGNLVQFERELKDITTDYSDSEVAPLAEEMLRLYADGRTPVKGPVSSNLIAQRNNAFSIEQRELGNTQIAEEAASSYTIDHKSEHALIILVNPETDMNRLKFNVADYNFSKFLLNDYEMSDTKLLDGTPVLSVMGFRNRLEALDYFYSLRERSDIFEVNNLNSKLLYVIHSKNMEYLLSSGDKEGYKKFFADNYLSAEAFKNLEVERRNEQLQAQETAKRNAAEAQKQVQEPLDSQAEIIQEVNTQEQAEVPSETISPVTEKVEEKQVEPETKEEAVGETQEAVVADTPLFEKAAANFVVQQGEHNGVVLFKKGRIDTKRIATLFTNYTKSNYGAKYEVDDNTIGEEYFYILIKGFASADEANAFLNKVKLNTFLMREISRVKHYLWPITNDNLLQLSNEESIELYQQFYKSNY